MRHLLIGFLAANLALPALAQEEAAPAAAGLIQSIEPATLGPAAWAPPSRVGRVSLVSGNVRVRTSQEWLDAGLNYPLAAAVALRTETEARAELEIGDDTIELAPDSEIEIGKLQDRAIEITFVRGRIGVAVRRLADGERVEVEVSRNTVRLLEPGHYDIEASTGRVAISPEPAPSDYDETRLAALYYVSRYVTGLAELDAAGNWQSTLEYGAVWVPTGLPADWAPYRDGHWRWIAPWGWTWIDDRPWGFATSHYGRWAFVGEHWAWVPGSFVPHPVYVPAVVAFLGTAGVGLSVADSTGPGIGWFPLAPGEAYWPSYNRDLAYVRSLNQGSVLDLEAIQLDANGEPPLEVVDGHFANRRFASVVPRPVFVDGGAVAQALLTLPEQRLQDAPVLMGSPQVSPPVRHAASAAFAIARPSRTEWVNHIAALVARGMHRARALQTAFMHRRDADRASWLHGAHLRAPVYAQATQPRHSILLRVAHVAHAPAHGGAGKGTRY